MLLDEEQQKQLTECGYVDFEIDEFFTYANDWGFTSTELASMLKFVDGRSAPVTKQRIYGWKKGGVERIRYIENGTKLQIVKPQVILAECWVGDPNKNMVVNN